MKEYLKRGTDGSVDLNATVEAFRTAVVEYKANSELPQETLVKALREVFESRTEKRLPMGLLTTLAADRLKASSSNLNSVVEALRLSVRANKDSFRVVQGKLGGVERVSSETAEV